MVLLLQPGQTATVRGLVESVRERSTSRRNLRIVTAQIVDDTRRADGGLVQPAPSRTRARARLARAGAWRGPGGEGGSLEMAVKEYELVLPSADDEGAPHRRHRARSTTPRARFPSRLLHGIVAENLHRLDAEPDPLPPTLRVRAGCRCAATPSAAARAPLGRTSRAARAAGSPTRSCCCCSWRCCGTAPPSLPPAAPRRCRRRASSSPLLARPAVRAHRRAAAGDRRDRAPTSARTAPMQRLLQGDVGSGKTAVALPALLRAVEAGGQAALMAPTEVLAAQHLAHAPSGCSSGLGVEVALLTGDVPTKERDARRQRHRRRASR